MVKISKSRHWFPGDPYVWDQPVFLIAESWIWDGKQDHGKPLAMSVPN